MKKLFRLNNNICDQIHNEAQIHFTKNCSNRCPFCIDAFNNGVGNKKPDIDKIFLSVLNIKDKQMILQYQVVNQCFILMNCYNQSEI